MALAKGLGGGLPIGAALSTERCSVLTPGDHGSTFSEIPSSAPPLAWYSITSPLRGFLEAVARKGDRAAEELRRLGREDR